jgi:hypothetical protein
LQRKCPINPSSLTRFRHRLGSVRLERILSLTVAVAVKSEAIKVTDLKKVIVDTTVMPKNIEFPTDSKLYNKARIRLVKLATKNGIELRQNYNLTAKTLLTEPLPANAGRFVISMCSNVIEYSFISNITASRAKVTPRPKSSTPISLT